MIWSQHVATVRLSDGNHTVTVRPPSETIQLSCGLQSCSFWKNSLSTNASPCSRKKNVQSQYGHRVLPHGHHTILAIWGLAMAAKTPQAICDLSINMWPTPGNMLHWGTSLRSCSSGPVNQAYSYYQGNLAPQILCQPSDIWLQTTMCQTRVPIPRQT